MKPSAKSERKKVRWTVMFIGDRGKTFTLRRVKEAIVTFSSLLVILSSTSICFCFMYVKARQENRIHQKEITEMEKRILDLQHEKDVLAAKLVLSGGMDDVPDPGPDDDGRAVPSPAAP